MKLQTLSAAWLAAAAPCNPVPAPVDYGAVDLDLRDHLDLSGDVSEAHLSFVTDITYDWYEWSFVAEDGDVTVAFHLPDGEAMPLSFDAFDAEGSALEMTLHTADRTRWLADGGTIVFEDCLQPGALHHVDVERIRLVSPTTEAVEWVSGEWDVRVPNTEAARQFADLHCP